MGLSGSLARESTQTTPCAQPSSFLNQKKEMHLSAFKFCLDEMAISLATKESAFEQRPQRDTTRFKLRSDCPSFMFFTAKIEDEPRGFLARHEQVDAADYLEEELYRAMVVEMLAAKRVAESKMEWYLVDSSQYLGLLVEKPFRTAHRVTTRSTTLRGKAWL